MYQTDIKEQNKLLPNSFKALLLWIAEKELQFALVRLYLNVDWCSMSL